MIYGIMSTLLSGSKTAYSYVASIMKTVTVSCRQDNNLFYFGEPSTFKVRFGNGGLSQLEEFFGRRSHIKIVTKADIFALLASMYGGQPCEHPFI